jgi:hypothetical protein
MVEYSFYFHISPFWFCLCLFGWVTYVVQPNQLAQPYNIIAMLMMCLYFDAYVIYLIIKQMKLQYDKKKTGFTYTLCHAFSLRIVTWRTCKVNGFVQCELEERHM